MGDGAVELQLAAAMGAPKVFEEAAAGEAGEDLDGGEPDAALRLPLGALDVEARVRHHHVQMGMEAELLISGVEHGDAADAQAAVPGIAGRARRGSRPVQRSCAGAVRRMSSWRAAMTSMCLRSSACMARACRASASRASFSIVRMP